MTSDDTVHSKPSTGSYGDDVLTEGGSNHADSGPEIYEDDATKSPDETLHEDEEASDKENRPLRDVTPLHRGYIPKIETKILAEDGTAASFKARKRPVASGPDSARPHPPAKRARLMGTSDSASNPMMSPHSLGDTGDPQFNKRNDADHGANPPVSMINEIDDDKSRTNEELPLPFSTVDEADNTADAVFHFLPQIVDPEILKALIFDPPCTCNIPHSSRIAGHLAQIGQFRERLEESLAWLELMADRLRDLEAGVGYT